MFLRFRSALPLALARTFSLWFGTFAPCRSGIDFTMPAKGSRAAHDNRKVWCGLRQILFA